MAFLAEGFYDGYNHLNNWYLPIYEKSSVIPPLLAVYDNMGIVVGDKVSTFSHDFLCKTSHCKYFTSINNLKIKKRENKAIQYYNS